jgi:hypothetical protein
MDKYVGFFTQWTVIGLLSIFVLTVNTGTN